jgi:hypothetical protein
VEKSSSAITGWTYLGAWWESSAKLTLIFTCLWDPGKELLWLLSILMMNIRYVHPLKHGHLSPSLSLSLTHTHTHTQAHEEAHLCFSFRVWRRCKFTEDSIFFCCCFYLELFCSDPECKRSRP